MNEEVDTNNWDDLLEAQFDEESNNFWRKNDQMINLHNCHKLLLIYLL